MTKHIIIRKEPDMYEDIFGSLYTVTNNQDTVLPVSTSILKTLNVTNDASVGTPYFTRTLRLMIEDALNSTTDTASNFKTMEQYYHSVACLFQKRDSAVKQKVRQAVIMIVCQNSQLIRDLHLTVKELDIDANKFYIRTVMQQLAIYYAETILEVKQAAKKDKALTELPQIGCDDMTKEQMDEMHKDTLALLTSVKNSFALDYHKQCMNYAIEAVKDYDMETPQTQSSSFTVPKIQVLPIQISEMKYLAINCAEKVELPSKMEVGPYTPADIVSEDVQKIAKNGRRRYSIEQVYKKGYVGGCVIKSFVDDESIRHFGAHPVLPEDIKGEEISETVRVLRNAVLLAQTDAEFHRMVAAHEKYQSGALYACKVCTDDYAFFFWHNREKVWEDKLIVMTAFQIKEMEEIK